LILVEGLFSPVERLAMAGRLHRLAVLLVGDLVLAQPEALDGLLVDGRAVEPPCAAPLRRSAREEDRLRAVEGAGESLARLGIGRQA